MRAMSLCFSCCAVLIGLAVPNDLRAEAVKVTPELTVFTDEKTPPADGRPTVLRGSATKRGTVDSRDLSYYPAPQFRFGTGEKLWLADPVSGRVILCRERRTSRVGSRFIGCLEDQLPYAFYE